MESGKFYVTPTKNNLTARMYLHQNHGTGSDKTQQITLNPNVNSDSFGGFAANDWQVYDSRGPNAKLIARAKGQQIQSGMGKKYWGCTFDLVIMEGSFKDSTLLVRGGPVKDDGEWDDSDWAIFGGTGQFSQAQGTIHRKLLQENGNIRIVELNIIASYAPPKKQTQVGN